MTRLLAATCALCISMVSPAHAERGEMAVEVTAAGDPATTASMAKRVRAAASRLKVSTRWQDRARIDARDVLAEKDTLPGVLARVWLDLSDPGRAVLYVANSTHDRFLVRVVPASDGYGELTQESLTTILESLIDALIAGGQIGVDREEATRSIQQDLGVPVEAVPPVVPEPSEPQPPPPAPEDRSATASFSSNPWSAVDLAYRIDAVAEGPSFRHGPQIALSFTGFLSPSLDVLFWFAGHYAPSSALGGENQVSVHGGGARAAVGVTGRLTRALAWQAAVGGGLDAFGVEAQIAPGSGLVRADDFLIAVPVATTFLGASVRLTRWVSLPIAVGLDVDLSGHHFDAQLESDRATLVRPWVLHPFATIGIGVPLTP